MHAISPASSSPGGRAAPWLALLLDGCIVLVAAGASSMGYGQGLGGALAAWGVAGAAFAAAMAVVIALGYAGLRRSFTAIVRHMIDRELEVERLVATFRALRFPAERHYDDLPNYLSRVLHDPASVPTARRFAAQALSEIAGPSRRSWIAAACRAGQLDAAVVRYLAEDSPQGEREPLRIAARA